MAFPTIDFHDPLLVSLTTEAIGRIQRLMGIWCVIGVLGFLCQCSPAFIATLLLLAIVSLIYPLD